MKRIMLLLLALLMRGYYPGIGRLGRLSCGRPPFW